MAATAVQNPAARPESKSAKKKKAKAESIASSAPANAPAASEGAPESQNGDSESPYIKELQKNIRNINKKIANVAKVELIIAEHPGLKLDELVSARKINSDQKAQVLKKPSLQASLTQLEEQVAQYKKIDQEYKEQASADKAELEKRLSELHKTQLEEAVAAAKVEAAEKSLKEQQNNMLVLSKYLRLVAARRAEEDADTGSDEHEALEGVLLAVYTGDESAVETMLKLTQGSDEQCYSVAGEQLQTTYAQVKAAALAYGATIAPEETEEPTPTNNTVTDPTMANAGLTEIDDPTLQTLANGHPESPAEVEAGVLQNASAGDEAANATAEASWDQGNDLSASQEWVEVPREAAETDNGVTATPAAHSNVQSWADEQPDAAPASAETKGPAPAASAPAPANDGFHEVRRNSGRERGERGRGGRGGGYRGRGGRGDGYRGRGRGGPRGEGGPRPPRRTEDA